MRVLNVYLVAGLGNPGLQYRGTRHNVGCQFIDAWRRGLGVRLIDRGFQSKYTWTAYEGNEVILLRPLTFMNRSGSAVRACADFYGIVPEQVLIVHDDLDLPVGRLKMARGSGSGGHKGVQSIIEHLGSKEFCRLKIGIGRPCYGESVEDYVLSPFYDDEQADIQEVLQTAIQACEWFIVDGIESAMNKVNRQPPAVSPNLDL
jgi:peptidyl-tRNA hydrolase, PTH1 family